MERGNYLRTLRGQKGVSIFKAAKGLGISATYLSELERDLKTPSDIILEKLATYYEVSRDDMFAHYDKVLPEGVEFILENNDFMKTLTKLALDKSLNDEDRDYIFEVLSKTYAYIVDKKKL